MQVEVPPQRRAPAGAVRGLASRTGRTRDALWTLKVTALSEAWLAWWSLALAGSPLVSWPLLWAVGRGSDRTPKPVALASRTPPCKRFPLGARDRQGRRNNSREA